MRTLKLLREQKDKTQVEMAKILDISPQRYNMYENGRRKLPVKIAKKAANYFGVTLDDIFFGNNLNTAFKKRNRLKLYYFYYNTKLLILVIECFSLFLNECRRLLKEGGNN